ncbi:unnamed protein product [Darwinula stevensoni]|uniref:Pre-mRNA-processing factor 39 n=1 Tax=Darwinula stevensoni TaxID=69355 RepID=A0A7R8XAE2_9CRUS|nr:unnamed protein product [Darwinula stevensoni]CAG0883691.1 unnamed protein product [Darwinula stevensoni]
MADVADVDMDDIGTAVKADDETVKDSCETHFDVSGEQGRVEDDLKVNGVQDVQNVGEVVTEMSEGVPDGGTSETASRNLSEGDKSKEDLSYEGSLKTIDNLDTEDVKSSDVDEYEKTATQSQDEAEEMEPEDEMFRKSSLLLTDRPRTSAKKLKDLEKYWKPLKEDPNDFTGWTYLLQYVDQESDVEAAEEAYDEFLRRYPYCYGYWKKYADYERRKSTKKACEEVFTRGVKAIPLSVDLWIHYLNYLKSQYGAEAAWIPHIREVFEDAVAKCGLEYRSSKLWDLYIKWEISQRNFHTVFTLYERLLQIPTVQYKQHIEAFTEFVNTHNPKDILAVDEFLELRKEVIQAFKESQGGVSPAMEETVGDDIPPGLEDEEPPPGADDESAPPTTSSVKMLKRPYFHVKPLEKAQLKVWKHYLKFETEEGSEERIHILFERCLIACALYEDFWLMYIGYLLEKNEGPEIIRDVFERACTIHLPKKININLKWSAFEEGQGNFEKALDVLQTLEGNMGPTTQVAFRCINLCRRSNQLENAEALFHKYIDYYERKQLNPEACSFILKYSRFIYRVLQDPEKAMAILRDAIIKHKDNPRIHLQAVDTLLHDYPNTEKEIVGIFDAVVQNQDFPPQFRLLFSQRRVEFLEDFGTDVSKLQAMMDAHLSLLRTLREDRKRTLDEEDKLDADQPTKRTRTSSSSSSSSRVNSKSFQPQQISTTSQQKGATVPSSQSYAYQYQTPYQHGYSYPYPYQNWNYGYNYSQGGWGGYSYYQR